MVVLAGRSKGLVVSERTSLPNTNDTLELCRIESVVSKCVEHFFWRTLWDHGD